MDISRKRKLASDDAPEESAKRVKMTPLVESSTTPTNGLASAETNAVANQSSSSNGTAKEKEASAPSRLKRQIHKMKPIRPHPTVPPSVAATGPRSAHREGKNTICLTRKTPLGAYMRRCKDVIIKDGYKTLHLSAMGAAIPLLLQLVSALPPILPFSKDEIHVEITTGSLEVQDEVIPEDEDEDISYQTRCKSTLSVVLKIGDGEFEGDKGALRRYSAGKTAQKNAKHARSNHAGKKDLKGKAKQGGQKADMELVYEEPEQEEML